MPNLILGKKFQFQITNIIMAINFQSNVIDNEDKVQMNYQHLYNW